MQKGAISEREREYVGVPMQPDCSITIDQFEFIGNLQRCMVLVTLFHFAANQFVQMQ